MKYLTAAVAALPIWSPAFAEDLTPKIAAHLRSTTPEIKIDKTRSDNGKSIVCGTITLRKDAHNYSTRTFAYVVDDDRLWTAEDTWPKEPQKMGIIQVMKYCPGN